MNRLVIVGNGFDLAHGLPTGYCDFIDWYWRKVIENITLPIYNHGPHICEYEFINIQFQFNADYYELIKIRSEFLDIKSFDQLNEILQKYQISDIEKEYITANPNRSVNNCKLTINNHFFKTINDKQQIQTWVDIENEYYKLLKNCLRENDNQEVKKLNEEFEQIKKLLEEYLTEEVTSKYNFKPSQLNSQMLSLFDLYKRRFKESYLLEFRDKEEDQNYVASWIDNYLEMRKSTYTKNDLKVSNLFLTFNYTPTLDAYCAHMNGSYMEDYGECEIIQIHGKLNDKNNPINFGFGDEMDNHYKLIEEKDDNEYLKNIKSFQYLQNSNYKSMLRFIESDKFQVYVMGHSCGLSDRVLLNKIFENENCLSIKVFYHKYDEPKPDGRADDYTNIVQNISRHFNKKEMMREKIVNKTLCEPLPQIQLSLKQ